MYRILRVTTIMRFKTNRLKIYLAELNKFRFSEILEFEGTTLVA
jgi:hypothetical protein